MFKFGNVLSVKKNAVKICDANNQWVAVDMCLVELVNVFDGKVAGLNIVRCENGRPIGEVNWRAMSRSYVKGLWNSYSAKV